MTSYFWNCLWNGLGTIILRISKKNPPYTSFKLLVTEISCIEDYLYICFQASPTNMTLGWIWDCTRSEAINNKPLGPINISSQSITGVELCCGLCVNLSILRKIVETVILVSLSHKCLMMCIVLVMPAFECLTLHTILEKTFVGLWVVGLDILDKGDCNWHHCRNYEIVTSWRWAIPIDRATITK
jgi:hypothetical protein